MNLTLELSIFQTKLNQATNLKQSCSTLIDLQVLVNHLEPKLLGLGDREGEHRGFSWFQADSNRQRAAGACHRDCMHEGEGNRAAASPALSLSLSLSLSPFFPARTRSEKALRIHMSYLHWLRYTLHLVAKKYEPN